MVFAYGAGALVVLGLALALLAIPIQVSDSFGNMLKLSTPWPQFVVQEFTQPSYLRPFLWLQLKAVHDLSGGHYYAWFRGLHVVQVVVLVGLFLHLVRPRTWHDAAAVPLGLAVLVGHHAFTGTVNEAFPINTFLTVVICCLAAAALALGKERPVEHRAGRRAVRLRRAVGRERAAGVRGVRRGRLDRRPRRAARRASSPSPPRWRATSRCGLPCWTWDAEPQ